MAAEKSLQQRIEEAIREEISVVPFNSKWKEMFFSEVEFLRNTLPKSLVGRIEHFGSTAVENLAAKPIIDILIEVASLTETKNKIVPILEAKGYEYFWRTDVSPAYAWFIKRIKNGARTHHLHFVEADSRLWERLYFRDYLREFPETANDYAKLKLELAGKFPKDRIGYTKGKTDFIVAITEAALQYYGIKN